MKACVDLAEDRWSHNVKPVMLVQCLLVSFFLLADLLYPSFGIHPERYIYPLCVFLLILFAWTLFSWRALTGNLFDPYTLFMTAAYAFNAGLAILEVFHLNKGGLLDGRFSQQTILATLLLVTIGLTAFHSGALLAVFVKKERAAKPSGAIQNHEHDGLALRQVGWFLISVAIIPSMLFYMRSFAAVTSSGYIGLFQQQEMGFGAWAIVLSQFMVPGALFLLAGSKGKWLNVVVSSGIILFHVIFLLLLGGRAGAIMPLLAYLWLFDRTIVKVPKTAIAVIGTVLILVVIPSIAVSRSTTGQARYSLTSIVDAYKSVENPYLAGVSEMGGSMETVSYTIELVPKTKEYEAGASYYYSILMVVPNFFWNVHPANVGDRQPSQWLAKEVDPGIAARGGGFGYSFIAEAYLNMGWWGTVVILSLMGVLFGSLVIWAERSRDLARLALLASFLSFFLFFARGQSSDMVRALIWYSLLPYLAVGYLSRRRSNSALPI